MKIQLTSSLGKIRVSGEGSGLLVEAAGDFIDLPWSLVRALAEASWPGVSAQQQPILPAAATLEQPVPVAAAPAPKLPKKATKPVLPVAAPPEQPVPVAAAPALVKPKEDTKPVEQPKEATKPVRLMPCLRDHLAAVGKPLTLDALVKQANAEGWPITGDGRQAVLVTLRKNHDVFVHLGDERYALVGQGENPATKPPQKRKTAPAAAAPVEPAVPPAELPSEGKGVQLSLWQVLRDWMAANPGEKSIDELVAAGTALGLAKPGKSLRNSILSVFGRQSARFPRLPDGRYLLAGKA